MNSYERLFQKTRNIIPFLWLPYFLGAGVVWIVEPAVSNRAILISVRNISVVLMLSVYLAFLAVNQFAYFRWTGKYPLYRLFPRSRERVIQRQREIERQRLQDKRPS